MSAQELNSQGNAFFRKQDFASAQSCYEKAIAKQPDYAEAHCNLGIILTALNHETKAITHLEKAIALIPTLLPALNQLGDIYLRRHEYKIAKTLFEKALSYSPIHIKSHYQLGVIFYAEKQHELSRHHFESVLSQNHSYEDTNQYLANIYLALSDHEKAMYYYFRQLEKNPLFETYYNLGFLFMMKERLNDALSYFDAALKINPNDFSAQLNCAHVYLKKNHYQEAIAHYQKALSLKPDVTEIPYILSAIEKNKIIPTKAPSDFVSNLFDQYAPYYDLHLTQRLAYDSPQKIIDAVQCDYPAFSDELKIIVDLGCGTGLCGLLFKSFSKKLIGVDLSENMLIIARERQIYDELIQDDIAHALSNMDDIDCIIAADVFTYCGDLI